MEKDEQIREFLDKLKKHAERKRTMYDGLNHALPVDTLIRLCAEELGEVSAAVTRERPLLAMYECLDIAHCAMLLYMRLQDDSS